MKRLTTEFWEYIKKNRDKKGFDKIYNWLIAKMTVVAVLTGLVFFTGYMIGAAVAVHCWR